MTSINSYSATLTLAAGGFVDNAKLARGEGAALTRTIRGLVDPSETLRKQMALLETAVQKEAITEATANEVRARLTAKLRDATGETARAAEAQKRHNDMMAEGERITRSLLTTEERRAASIRQLSTLRDAGAISQATYNRGIAQAGKTNADTNTSSTALLGTLGRLAAGYLTISTAANVFKSSIGKAIEVENAQTQFEVLTGSAQKAEMMLRDLRKLAVESPLTLSDTTTAARTLLSFNVSAEKVLPTLNMLGDVTGGNSDRFKMMSLAFAQASAAGRLMGQDLLQMINAGFNPLQERSKRTGQSLIELRKVMEDGAYSSKMMVEDFESATAAGGRFYGMIDKISTTTGGAMQQAAGAIELLQIQLGESLSPLVRQVSTDLMELNKNSDSTKASMDGLGQATLGFYNFTKSEISLIPAFARSIGLLGSTLGEASDVFNSFSLFNSLQSSKSIEEASKLLEKATQTERDALTRRFRAGTMPDQQRDGVVPPYLTAISKMLSEIAEQEAKLKSLGEKQTAVPESPMDKEATKLQNKFETMRDTLRGQLEKLKEGKAAATELKAEMKGFTDIQQATISNLAKEIEAIEKRNKAEKDRAREQARLQKEAVADAERLRKSYETATEKLARQFAEIDRLRRVNAISPFEAERAKQEAVKDTTKQLKIESPKSMEVNSQQGADWLANWRNTAIGDKAKENQAVVNAIKGLKDEQRETNRKLDKLAEVQPRNKR